MSGRSEWEHGGRDASLSRRRLLSWSVAGMAGAALVAAVDPAVAAPARPPATPSPKRPTRSPAPVRSAPVRRLREVRPAAAATAVALTVDDGPHPTWTPRVLEVLRQNNIRASFFMVGVQARTYPGLVRRVLAEGHTVCNHSLDHPTPFSRRTAPQVVQEITQAQSIITGACGRAPRFFRAPGGDWSPQVLAAVARQGMIPVGWSVDPRDWARPGTESIVRSLAAARAGDILLCHDGGGDRAQTVEALRQVLPRLRAGGLTFERL